jgi:hypothetical protein
MTHRSLTLCIARVEVHLDSLCTLAWLSFVLVGLLYMLLDKTQVRRHTFLFTRQGYISVSPAFHETDFVM